MTGWSQVSGRNRVEWDVRLAQDVWYVDHASFRLDLAILGRTARQLVPVGRLAGGENAIMTRFAGTAAGIETTQGDGGAS